MTISYNWLSEYLPVTVTPDRLSNILTSIGLEVEKMETFEQVKGSLKGLVIGEVLEVEQHSNADKLRVTKVNTGGPEFLQIVCGAPNVTVGQKVVVATAGTTIYPTTGEPLTMKLAKIRGTESHGMICAEDEIGLGHSHAGIMVLPEDAAIGQTATNYFQPYTDIIYEIGLTPNRMDAMSHLGVARDVCAYLTHHDKKDAKPVFPAINFRVDNQSLKINVEVTNAAACRRYTGVCISNIEVKESPEWLKNKLKAIGLRPINNIVDITNFVQHETGQPLHAFDYDAVKGQKIIVRTEEEGTAFTTLDDKERKLSNEDLMICNEESGMCIAGVFGGAKSGVSERTKNIFLESAWFDPMFIRKTSFRHNLRTDSATRFEKGVDISNTVTALKRAAILVKELAKGEIASDIIDSYPQPQPKKQINFKLQFLKKLSGKTYDLHSIKNILQALGFSILTEYADSIVIDVPYHKHDIAIPADIVEEIVRIDGLDNIEIPTAITITPSVASNKNGERIKEKTTGFLIGSGFNEILTNSITNSKYFSKDNLNVSVKLLNNLSSELDVLRPAMLPTALEVIAFNHNRRNTDLMLFEFGKTYNTSGIGDYSEKNHLCIYLTGNIQSTQWKGKSISSDLFHLKGIAEALFKLLGVEPSFSTEASSAFMETMITANIDGQRVLKLGKVAPKVAMEFDVREAVFFANFDWGLLINAASLIKIKYREIPKFPAVDRDLALVLPRSMKYDEVTNQLGKLSLEKLREVKLFDLFESEKLGADKKSLAVNFTFLDEEKTLTDKEIDGWMNKIISTLEKELGAEIRK